MDLSWGSPVGMGAWLAGLGVFFWGFFNGLAAMARAKAREAARPDQRGDS